jgi:translocation and assembly module TamA
VALNAEYDQVEDNFNDRDLILASLPSELVYDGTDNRLEPTTGFKAKLSVEPYHEFEYGSTGAFMRAEGSTYFAFDEAGRYVIAGRVAVGSILGGAADELPADRLFVAGGGGSVRGYAYRSIGPRLPNGDIVGGLSLAEASLEFRAKITDTIGVVPFLDAGGAFASRYPDLSDDIKLGAGIGVRYYTGLGAIRVDVATPLNPERGDSRFALYIGLGESF